MAFGLSLEPLVFWFLEFTFYVLFLNAVMGDYLLWRKLYLRKKAGGGDSSFAKKEMSVLLDRRITAELRERRKLLEQLWDECEAVTLNAPEGQLHVLKPRGYTQYRRYMDVPIDGSLRKRIST